LHGQWRTRQRRRDEHRSSGATTRRGTCRTRPHLCAGHFPRLAQHLEQQGKCGVDGAGGLAAEKDDALPLSKRVRDEHSRPPLLRPSRGRCGGRARSQPSHRARSHHKTFTRQSRRRRWWRGRCPCPGSVAESAVDHHGCVALELIAAKQVGGRSGGWHQRCGCC